VTRSPSVRTRLLGLEVVALLVDRLREEYLALLPEVRREPGPVLVPWVLVD
jgi:hypothetical protein